ncbi:hypothetical protein [Lysinibacillus xylanilyticus]|uniref:hypothetical protein n=1 Tax=Lysinibacillus xylanilyticus TaxID=582475 RepID=UPI003829698D
MFYLCESEATATKRPSERKSTTRYDDEHKIADKAINIDGNRHMALDLKWYSIV